MCPRNTGRTSRNATTVGVRSTSWAGASWATIRQNTQYGSWLMGPACHQGLRAAVRSRQVRPSSSELDVRGRDRRVAGREPPRGWPELAARGEVALGGQPHAVGPDEALVDLPGAHE